MNRQQLEGLFVKIFPVGDSKAFCDHIFRIFDDDKSNTIEFKEFIVSVFLELKNEKAELNRKIDEQNIKIQELSDQVKSLETENNLAFDFKDQEIKDLKDENKSLRDEIDSMKVDVKSHLRRVENMK